MKKLFLLITLALASIASSTPLAAKQGTCGDKKHFPCPPSPCVCKATSKTFFADRPLYQTGSPIIESLFYDRTEAAQDGCGGAVEFALFGSQTTDSTRGNLAAYFMPCCKTQLRVKSNAIRDEGLPADIVAEEFNIITVNDDFESLITFAPQQTIVGLGFTYRQTFARCDARQFWFGISTPLTRVKNTMSLCENVINNGGGVLTEEGGIETGAVANMTQAFAQPNWTAGRIDCACEVAKTYLADITLELGYEYLRKENLHAESHVGIVIPTGNEVRNHIVFEPMVGNNHHFGATFGSGLGIEIWTDCDRSLWMEMQIHSIYFFSHTERRLMDVKGRPWSRYMQVYRNQAQAELAAANDDPFLYTPGVNVFAQPVCVTPGFQRTVNTAFVYSHCNFQAEAGYHFFARSAECVQLKCGYAPDTAPAFKALEGAGFTNDQLTINGGFVNEPVGIDALNKPVTEYASNIIPTCALDLASATHPTIITHTLYGTLGYRWDDRERPLFAGIGGSYEFSEDNGAVNRWVFWGKAGFSF
jgi:hypothetical protein